MTKDGLGGIYRPSRLEHHQYNDCSCGATKVVRDKSVERRKVFRALGSLGIHPRA